FHDGGRFGPPGGRGPGVRADDEAVSEYFIAVESPETGSFNRIQSALADENESPPKLDAADLGRRAASADQDGPRPFDAKAEAGDGSWRLVAVYNRGGGGVTGVGQSPREV